MAVLEVCFPDGIVGVGFFPDLDVSYDLRIAGFDQRYPISLVVLVRKHPDSCPDGVKITFPDPSGAFPRMSAFGPLP